MGYVVSILFKLVPFIGVTLFMAIMSMLLGLVLGGILTVMKLSRHSVLRGIANGFTTLIRCTPVMVLLFLCYYGLPMLIALFGVDISNGSKLAFSIMALTLYAAGILSEIIRPAYLSIDKGQHEAAAMVGLSRFQAMRAIILPQLFFIALPNLGNMMISLIQESSLAYLIGVVDVMGQAKIINGVSYGLHIVEIYLAVSLIYWMLSLLTGLLVDLLTVRLGKVLR